MIGADVLDAMPVRAHSLTSHTSMQGGVGLLKLAPNAIAPISTKAGKNQSGSHDLSPLRAAALMEREWAAAYSAGVMATAPKYPQAALNSPTSKGGAGRRLS